MSSSVFTFSRGKRIGGAVQLVCCLAAFAAVHGAEKSPQQIDFGRDIQPILSENCYQCHGPDEAERQADLRLDRRDHFYADRDGLRLVAAGEPAKSELLRRVASSDKDEVMPPPDNGLKLGGGQIALIRRWIEQGGQWTGHWAFTPPQRPALPAVKNERWPRNAIDRFVLHRLEREGLTPSPEADGATLMRRVTLDLTGLPPTPAEVDAFLADDAPHAYERLVDRLLGSPRYGERMAVPWLDAARYADTSGYQTDGARQMWRWRDWVIDAFNRNTPYDQFTIEQLAGDLLPADGDQSQDAKLRRLIATGFNRNHRANSEGGIIDEEFLVEYAVDRVETTGTVWLGLTVGCARCHDHKYDPLSQKDFYRLFALFNNLPEMGRVFKHHNARPLVKAPTMPMRRRLSQLDEQLAAASERLASLHDELAKAQLQWEQSPTAREPAGWMLRDGLAVRFSLDEHLREAAGVEASKQSKPGQFRDGEANFAAGKLDSAVQLDGRRYVDAGPIVPIRGDEPISVSAWVHPRRVQNGAILSVLLADATRPHGFSLHLHENRIRFYIGPRWIDDGLRLQSKDALRPNEWQHVLLTYDGSEWASGVKIYVDGRPQRFSVLLDKLTGGFDSSEPLRIGFGAEGLRFDGAIDEVRIYRRELSEEEAAIIACGDAIEKVVATPQGKRTEAQRAKLARYFLTQQSPEAIRRAYEELVSVQRQRDRYYKTIPTVMVMQEQPKPSPTFVLKRGQYDQPGGKVEAGVPSWLLPLPAEAPADRLGLAQWLVGEDNPLTARVTVNRFWQMYFGRGLVATSEDFGMQGARPSHPALLDWLASELVRSGWDVKAMQRLIVTSATYRQSSRLTPELLKRDPENVLLARAPRLRLPAEMIRDQALAAGGLLRGDIGGPSVKPYQPTGIWEELSGLKYEADRGENLYRRSMYTFWKRTIPPTTMAAFDGPTREFCQVQRSRTNTPLQALALLNDTTYVEAARALAERMIGEAAERPEDRIAHGFRLLLTRQPKPKELDVLAAALRRAEAHFHSDKEAAAQLLAVGDSAPPTVVEPQTLAAYTVVASLILNLDEAIMRE